MKGEGEGEGMCSVCLQLPPLLSLTHTPFFLPSHYGKSNSYKNTRQGRQNVEGERKEGGSRDQCEAAAVLQMTVV